MNYVINETMMQLDKQPARRILSGPVAFFLLGMTLSLWAKV
jgi:hypothetical protein